MSNNGERPIDRVLSRLQNCKPSGDTGRKWVALCPDEPLLVDVEQFEAAADVSRDSRQDGPRHTRATN